MAVMRANLVCDDGLSNQLSLERGGDAGEGGLDVGAGVEGADADAPRGDYSPRAKRNAA
jgi:hypothetical protein